jgi:hypothetical protein
MDPRKNLENYALSSLHKLFATFPPPPLHTYIDSLASPVTIIEKTTVHCSPDSSMTMPNPKYYNDQKSVSEVQEKFFFFLSLKRTYCSAKAFYSCPAIISRRPESQNTPKESQLNPEEESRIKQARSHVTLEKSSKIYKPSEE